MPLYPVTITAVFRKLDGQLSVEAAAKAIINSSFAAPQSAALHEAALKDWLIFQVNELLKSKSPGVAIKDATTTLDNFTPATAGTSVNPGGIDGSFTFSLWLSRGGGEATVNHSGVITATPYAPPTAITALPSSTLRAGVTGGVLHLSGLTPGETLRLYNLRGLLLHQSRATAAGLSIPLAERGLYILIAGGKTLKIMY
jgi:hypothetical protein